MIKYTRLVVLLAASALMFSACGSSSKKATGDSAALDVTTTTAGSGKNPADVDVCALLSQNDANDVARAHSLDGAQTVTTTYTLTATKEASTGVFPTSSCKFTIADAGGASGTISFQVQSASGFSIYSSGTKVDGLGDEAYNSTGQTVVRVGSLMLSPGEDSFTSDFATDLMRKMAPKLK